MLNLFQGMSTDEYRSVMGVVEMAILSTDLASYFNKRERFLTTADGGDGSHTMNEVGRMGRAVPCELGRVGQAMWAGLCGPGVRRVGRGVLAGPLGCLVSFYA